MWQIAAAANLVIALAYLGICWAVTRGLVRTAQLWRNRLGTATAFIFLTCAVHHGAHSVHLLLPAVGLEEHVGRSLRASIEWHVVTWDLFGAAIGVWYWSLRASYGSLLQGGKLFDDLRERQQQALEINDTVLQGLAVVQLALEVGDVEQARTAAGRTIADARRLVAQLVGDQVATEGFGEWVRRDAPALRGEPS